MVNHILYIIIKVGLRSYGCAKWLHQNVEIFIYLKKKIDIIFLFLSSYPIIDKNLNLITIQICHLILFLIIIISYCFESCQQLQEQKCANYWTNMLVRFSLFK